MKKTIALVLTSAMLLSCTACTPKTGEGTPTPDVTTQAGIITETALPTAGLNNTFEPEETMYLPQATALIEATSAPIGADEPFEKGQYATTFLKTPETAEFSSPGYMGYVIINGRDDIDAYIEKFGSMMDFDLEFKEAMEKYDEAFFANKSLIIIMHEEAEGQGCGRVDSVKQFEDYVEVIVKCDTDWASYDDPSTVPTVRWQCVIEMNTDDIINNDVTVFEFQ